MREFEGRALNHQGTKPKCKASNKSKANFRPNGRGNNQKSSVDKKPSTLKLSADIIAAPEIGQRQRIRFLDPRNEGRPNTTQTIRINMTLCTIKHCYLPYNNSPQQTKLCSFCFRRTPQNPKKSSTRDVMHKQLGLNLFNNLFTIAKKYVIIYIPETNSFALK